MRSLSLILAGILSLGSTGAMSQAPSGGIPDELLCEQCPFDAPVRPRRDDFASPNATTVITAEDMRALGVISVADMVNQLPAAAGPDAVPEPAEDSEPASETPAAEAEDSALSTAGE